MGGDVSFTGSRMSEATATQRSRGMRDLLPDEMDRLRAVEDAFAAACRAWGYREIRTPVIEPLHLFTSAGTLSPRTLDRVYSFLDWDGWSGERVVLRPDSTIPAARLYAERLDGGRVAKLFYSQNVFRFTDDDSSREEWQCGVELMGDTGTRGDVELVLLALESLRPLGLHPVTVRLSHAGIVRAVLTGRAAMIEGRQADAAKAFTEAAVIEETEDFSVFSDPPAFWYPVRRDVAAALLAAGDREGARAAIEASLKLRPRDPAALELLERISRAGASGK